MATAATTGIACILMGLMSNFPFCLAPGMGTNAFFAFTVVLKFQVPWQTALAAIWIAGFVFAFLSVTGIRTYMVKIMPSCIRLSMACGIGLFLAFIGAPARVAAPSDRGLPAPPPTPTPPRRLLWALMPSAGVQG